MQNIKLPLNHLPFALIPSARLWLIKAIYGARNCGLMLPQHPGITYFLTFFLPTQLGKRPAKREISLCVPCPAIGSVNTHFPERYKGLKDPYRWGLLKNWAVTLLVLKYQVWLNPPSDFSCSNKITLGRQGKVNSNADVSPSGERDGIFSCVYWCSQFFFRVQCAGLCCPKPIHGQARLREHQQVPKASCETHLGSSRFTARAWVLPDLGF